MDIVEGLRQLLLADRWIEKVRAQRDHLPESGELVQTEASLRELLAELTQAQGALEPVQRRYDELAAEAAKLETRAEELDRALHGATAAREMETLHTERERVRERLDVVEVAELEALEALEPLQEAVTAIRRRAQPALARREELRGLVGELQASLDEEIVALTAQRDELALGLDQSWRQRYETCAQRAGGAGAAQLVEGRCDGCRIALSPLDLDRFGRVAEGDVSECPSCGRLLLP